MGIFMKGRPMLKTTILHPELIRGLAEAGHGAKILVADANYPATVKSPAGARRVFLNFTPGMIGGVDIIRALGDTIPVESAQYMHPDDRSVPEIVREYHKLLGDDVPFDGLGRFEFYEEAGRDDVALVIASGEQRTWANLLITVGVIQPK